MTPALRHEDFLRRLSTGELNPECDEARRHFSECSGCRERWHDMSRLIRELDAADGERRDVLAGLSEPTAPEIERAQRAGVAARVFPARVTSQRPARARPRLALVYASAAAIFVAVFFVLRLWTADREPSGVGPMLGANVVEILDDDGVLDAAGVTIRYPSGPMPSLRIELEGWSSEGKRVSDRRTVTGLESSAAQEAVWRPRPGMLERFAGRVTLRVQPITVDGVEVGGAAQREFSLSP